MRTTNLSLTLYVAKIFLALNALGAFFLDFVQIGPADCYLMLHGFDLVFGKTQSAYGVLAPNFWAALLLFACTLQLLAAISLRNRVAIWSITVATILILVMLQFDFIARWQPQGVSVVFGYWLEFSIFFALALCHAVEGNLEQKSRSAKQHLHINIFTVQKKE